ncbi:MAG: hypothetical protein KKG10_16485 [Proteobacteria bacterium]|nr:hypothetical protein [Pseudomonadota bacterium]
MKLSEIKELLHAEVIVGHDKLDTPVKAGTASDLMSDMLTGPNNDVVLLTGLCNIQVIRTSVIAGVQAIVFVRGKRPSKEMLVDARKHDIAILTTPFTMFTACGRLFSKGLRGVDRKSPEH